MITHELFAFIAHLFGLFRKNESVGVLVMGTLNGHPVYEWKEST